MSHDYVPNCRIEPGAHAPAYRTGGLDVRAVGDLDEQQGDSNAQ